MTISPPRAPRRRAGRYPAGIVLALLMVSACREDASLDPRVAPHAPPPPGDQQAAPRRRPNFELVDSLRRDLALERHAADGGGRAWLEPPPNPARAGAFGRWTIHYQAGELGVAEGGMVFLQVSPFWGWSTPQVERPQAPGYTEVSTAAEGVELTPRTLDQQLLGIAVAGRALSRGEQLKIVYGAGPAGARADRFAERDSRFWIAVDGDGDGVRKVLADSPGVDVGPGPAARLLLTLPSTARPGQSVRLTVAVLDAVGNCTLMPAAGSTTSPASGRPDAVSFDGEIRLEAPAGMGAPEAVVLRPSDLGRRTVELTAAGPGVVRIRAFGPGGLEAESNPLQVSGHGGRVLWGDLQNHSAASDGSATPEEQFLYARDIAALDVMSLTDHDHWGMLFLDRHAATWDQIRELTRRFHQPGRFVTLLGYEWTNWVHGHRHVLYFSDDGELYSSVDPAYDHPQELWQALRGRRALTIAHHSAGGPISTDWSIAPDPELEPVTEIVSVHGSSEALDSPSVIHRPVPGNFVRDALSRGYRLGFLGSSDGHDGHPGLGHLASPSGGLAAILAEELTREAVWEALRARRVYATSGPRILLRVSFGGYRMGADVPVSGRGDAPREGDIVPPRQRDIVPGIGRHTLVTRAIAPGAIEQIDVIRSGEVMDSVDCRGERECAFGAEIPDLVAGEYLYVRAVQKDGGAAWSSPFYFVEAELP